MADEISVSLSLVVTKGNMSYSRKIAAQKATMSGDGVSGGTQTVGSAAEEILVGADLTTPGWGFFRNLDSTETVLMGREISAVFEPFIKLLPGEAVVIRLDTLPVYAAVEGTGSAILEYAIFEM
jgi:hypothetical protein